MAKRRLLRLIIFGIVSITMAFVLAFAYVVLTDDSQDYIDTPDSNQPEVTKTDNEQEIRVDVGIVTGIMYNNGTPLATVDGVILRQGQSLHNVKIIKINPDSVEFEYSGTRWTQKVNELSSPQCIGTIDSRMLPKYLSVEDIVKYVSPAVVTISVYNDTGEELCMGSGFFIGNGKILTNAHVVEDAYSAEVQSLLTTYEDVKIAKRNDNLDLAVLEVQSDIEPTISLADDSELRVGQQVLAIGNPEGLERTVSDGLISAIRNWNGMQNIQISAPISHGSSGGPLLNMQGQVIGVTFAGYDEGQNLNFAIGIKTIKQFLKTPDHPVQLQTAGSYIPEKNYFNWFKKQLIGIMALAVIIISFVCFRKRLPQRIITYLRRKKIPFISVPKAQPYQTALLSNQKSEKYWRNI